MDARSTGGPSAAGLPDPRLALVPAELRVGRGAPPPSGGPAATQAPRGQVQVAPAVAAAALRGATEQLLRLAGAVMTVPDAATRLAVACLDAVPAAAAYVLLPDLLDDDRGPGDDGTVRVWRVSGSTGLRPLERRLQLADGHWLVRETVAEGRALVLERSDIARARLAGAPLAARHHLLAVPVPAVAGVVVLGRDESPFDESEIVVVAGLSAAHEVALGTALAVRHLARVLEPCVDAGD